jgi:ABC-type sugar transport system permease subunit
VDLGKTWTEVVGVAGDVRQHSLDAPPSDQIYVPLTQYPTLLGALLLRASGSPRLLERQVRDAVLKLDPEQPIDRFRTLDEVRSNALASPRLTALLLGLFAAVALVVTCAGIAGVIAFSVSERTQEFGIRLALGAAPNSVLSLVLDVRLMTQRRWGLVLARASLVGIARFPLLALPVESNRAVWLLLVAALPAAISGFVGVALLPRVTGQSHHLSPLPPSTRPMIRYSLVNWASTIAYQAPTFAMPVIVLVTLLRLGNILEGGFTQLFILYSLPVYSVGDIIDTWVYRSGILDFQFSLATAVGLFKGVIGLVLIIVSNRIAKQLAGRNLY